MKKNFKRWLALVLAVAMVAGTCLSHADGFLSATDGEPAVTQESETAVADQTEGGSGRQPVEEEQEIVIPKQEETVPEQKEPAEQEEAQPVQEMSAEQEEAQPVQEMSAEQEEVQPVQEEPAEETPAEQEIYYQVTFHRPAVDGGILYVWSEGEEAQEAFYTNDQYVKEAAEGTTLYFRIQNAGNYFVDKATDQYGSVLTPESTVENISTYKMVVSGDKAITILYKETIAEEPKQEETKPAEEEPKAEETKQDESEKIEYTLYIHHVLATNIGNFVDEREVKFTEKDFVNGAYDPSVHAYTKEGIQITSAGQPIFINDFDEQNEANCQILYEVAGGWKAVRKSEIGFFSIYVGTFEDVEIIPAGQMPVTISFVYEDGTLARTSETVMVTEKNDGYNFSYEVNVPDGYTMTAESADVYTVEGNVVSAVFVAGTERSSVQLIFAAKTVNYTVIDKFPGLKGEDDSEEKREDTTGKVGELTDVEPLVKEGFTAEPIDQQEIKANGSTEVTVEYRRNEYAVTYDTQGGSYIKAKKGLYEEEVDVYKETAGDKMLDCGLEEHTHSAKPTGDGSDGEVRGCYIYKKFLWWGEWKLTCLEKEHTHSEACYTTSDTVWDVMPVRQGYTFDGWYKDVECTEEADEKVTLIDNVTVYAKWIPKNVNYTVSYFIENADDNNYSYLTSSVKTALLGTNVTETASSATPSGLDTKNFTFARATTTTVKADGSAVIQVYYTRNVYTLVSKNAFDGKKLTLTAKYGATITDQMNQAFNTPTKNGKAWSTKNDQNTKVAVFDTMPAPNGSGNTITVYDFDYNTEKEQVLSYWLENYAGSETDTRGGKTYGLYKRITVKFNYLYYDSDFYDFPGYTKDDAVFNKKYSWGNSAPEGLKADLYYNANPYKLDLFGYQGKRLSSNDVKLGADIQSYLAEPTAPIEGAEFKGWYIDAEHTEKYAGDYKMPQGLTLYADWELPKLTVKYSSAGDIVKTETVEYQKCVENYIPPTREGYEFDGWYTDKDFENEFDVKEPITKDINVYAKWTENKYTTYTVRYVVREGEVFEDIADKKENLSGRVGQNIREKAKVFTEEPYSTYAVDAPSKTLKLEAAASENVIMFVYTAPTDLTYKVQYMYNDEVIEKADAIKAEAVTFNVYPDQTIADKLQKEKGYLINETFKNARLVSDNDKNIVEFTLRLEEYTITYQGIEGVTGWKEVEGTENPNPATYTAQSDNITIKNPEKIGYVFEGWELVDTNDESEEYGDGKSVVIEKGSRGHLIFLAKWSPVDIKDYVTLTPKDVVKTYDGTEYTAGVATAVDENGKTVKVEYSVNGTDWTEDPTTIKSTDVIDQTIQVRASVDGTYEGYVTGTQKLTISQREVTVTGDGWSSDQPYTGKEYKTTDYTFTNVVDGQSARISYELKGTEVGNYTGTFGNDFKVVTGGILGVGETDVTANYKLTDKTAGELTITKSEIAKYVTLTPVDVVETYDGTEYKAGVATAVDENGKTVKVEYSVNGTDWAEDPTTIKSTDVIDQTIQVRASVDGTYEGHVTGTQKLTINQREVTVTGDGWNSDQPYTGKEYKTTDYTFTNVVDGQSARISYELKGTEVGSYTGTFGNDFKVVTGGILGVGETDVTANYKLVTKTVGELTITKSEIAKYVTLTPVDVVETYDGTEYTAGVATAVDENGKTVKVEYSVNGTDWAEDPTTIKSTDVIDQTIQVRASVDGTYEGYVTGTQKLTINQREVTVTGDGWNSDQPYTGKEYKTTDYTFTNVVDGQSARISYELKGTEVGSYAGTFGNDFKVVTGGILGVGETDVTANYKLVTKTAGNLKIVASDINDYVTLTPVDVVKTYDGTEYTAGVATAVDENGKLSK